MLLGSQGVYPNLLRKRGKAAVPLLQPINLQINRSVKDGTVVDADNQSASTEFKATNAIPISGVKRGMAVRMIFSENRQCIRLVS